MRRRPRRGPGLRIRLVLALLLSSAATLTAVALIILPPLTQRLVSDRLADLRGLARTARPALRAVPEEDIHPGSRSLQLLAEHLERRTGGRIVIFDDNRAALADTANSARTPAIGNLQNERRRAETSRGDGVVTGRRSDLAYAVTTVRVHNDRLTLVVVKRLEDTRAAAAVVRGVLPLASAVGVAVALGLALLLSRSLLGRLNRLHADARALGEEGLGHPVSVSGGDEVTDVARALEAMRARLVEEEASRQAFVATASHELRTPLASLQATLELLREEVLEGDGDPDAAAARADTALRQTHRLVGLAQDLLDLSRVDGDVPLVLEPLEIGEQARMVAREFAGGLESADRCVDVEGGPALAVADARAVVRILRILLDNACRYGAGTITVRVSPGAQNVAVSVTDEGPGLEPGEEEAVFVRFARGSAAADMPGSGLGLAIARGLARAMDGDVLVSAAGRGASFTLQLTTWDGGAVTPVLHEDRTVS
jgi:signal transduction histidine kinase